MSHAGPGSWGRYPDATHSIIHRPVWRSDPLPLSPPGTSQLPYGLGRSYGDSCLNPGNALIRTDRLNRLITFDRKQGVLRCEAGVSLGEILRVIVPAGWFLPVTPGTKFVTVGGAVANDVHGKNHHVAGSFGHFVRALELLRSDGSRRACTPDENADWLRATIGGLGLTGLITWVEFQLIPIHNPWIRGEAIRYSSLDEFFRLSKESATSHEYTVSWVDCLSAGRTLGRGIFFRGNHASDQVTQGPASSGFSKSVPFDLPGALLNRLTLSVFNQLYFHLPRGSGPRLTHFDPFFYPLDSVHAWNRVYGRNGFLQYQCVVPFGDGQDAIREILGEIARAGTGSFLAVLKTFGDRPAAGLLSFPREGVTLALDFPNRPATFRLLERLDQVVLRARGAIYPAKDARMSPELFRASFPGWSEFSNYLDPGFSSGFIRRVSEGR